MSIEVITEEDYWVLDDLLREEKHPMVRPTHVIKRDGNVTGGLSIGSSIPISMFLSKKYENKLDILSIRRFVSSYCDSISNNHLLVHVGPTSPGWPILEKMGATYVGGGHFWYYESKKT